MKEEKPKSTKSLKRGRCRLKTEPGPDPSFKLKIILDYLGGNRDQRAVAAQYGISQTSLCYWIKLYLRDKETFMGKKSKKSEPPSSTEKELLVLKKQLEEERLKNIALQELIHVAEKQFNIPIQKKSGAKQ